MLATAQLQQQTLLHDTARLTGRRAPIRACIQRQHAAPTHRHRPSAGARRHRGIGIVASGSSSSVDAQAAEAAVLDALQGVKGRGSGGLPPDQQAAFDDAVKTLEAGGGVKASP